MVDTTKWKEVATETKFFVEFKGNVGRPSRPRALKKKTSIVGQLQKRCQLNATICPAKIIGCPSGHCEKEKKFLFFFFYTEEDE